MDIVKSADPQQAAQALETVCGRYWYPIYAYLRRSGQPAQDAEDITQMLFQRIITEDALQQVRREKGKLRTFLLSIVTQVISRKNRHQSAQKRGGNVIAFSLDEALADKAYEHELADTLDPERLFQRAWARQLLETVRTKLKDSFLRTGRAGAYQHLERYLGLEDTPGPFAELGTQLGCNEAAARVAVFRLRKKFRELLEQEVAKTVLQPSDVQDEMNWLREALSL